VMMWHDCSTSRRAWPTGPRTQCCGPCPRRRLPRSATTPLTAHGVVGWGVVCHNGTMGTHALQNLSLRPLPDIDSITSQRHFDLFENQFYRPIPGHLVNLSGLVHLNLSYNNFSPGFPTDGIRQLQNLCCIDLHNNSFWRNAIDLLTELRNAKHIDVSHNLFTSRVNLELVNLTNIGNTVKYLNLSYKKLEGSFFRNETTGRSRNY
jgi:hypothetical protein